MLPRRTPRESVEVVANRVEHYLDLGLYTKCALLATADGLGLDMDTVEKAWITKKINSKQLRLFNDNGNGGAPVR